ncbi:MAG: adenylate kinase [Bowdeniella nasicola]|nr:adenylate kinase [Bowdeniella nasicola]
MSTRLVIFGPPGAGKGTQAEKLATDLNIPTISTGDLFRSHMSEGSELGHLAASYISRGALVPDEVTVGMLRERLEAKDVHNGFLLDGFPRTLAQIDSLDDLLGEEGLSAVIELQVPDEELVDRLVKRGAESGRSDDTEDVIRNRLAVYHEQTAPVADKYRQRGQLITIDGTGSIDEIATRIREAVSRL